MIQRLSELKAPINFHIGSFDFNPFSEHPDLAVLAMGAISSWADVETYMLGLFVHLLGGNKTLAADIYLSLDGDGPKKVVIETAAKKLDPELQDLLRAILNVAGTNAKARHKLAHWGWNHSPHLPDAILLTDEKTQLKKGNVADHCYVYRAHDFQAIIDANARLCEYFSRFNALVRRRHAPEGEQLFRLLSEAPEIRERLDRRKVRKDQAAP